MKRFLLSSMLLVLMAQVTSNAQNKKGYTDDIYYNSQDAQRDAAKDESYNNSQYQGNNNSQGQLYQNEFDNNNQQYNQQNGNYSNNGRNYNSDDYIDYDDDTYYSTNLRRFNDPFYNLGYYSTFQNPYWYNPYWVDPYWGWSPWSRPGFSVSVGFGGPYWSSYWGWNTWYGYPGFYSYYSYPYYGGFGPYWGYGGGYYTGFWNGYYAGVCNGYGYYGGARPVVYGPRYSSNANYNAIRNNSIYSGRPAAPYLGAPSHQRELNGGNNMFAAPVQGGRNTNITPAQGGRDYNSTGRPQQGGFESNQPRTIEMSPRNNGNFEPQQAQPRQQEWQAQPNVNPDRSNRTNFYRGEGEQNAPRQMPQQPRNFQEPRMQQAPQPHFQQPHMEAPRSAPSMPRSAPSMHGGFGGGRSGGGFGGGRR